MDDYEALLARAVAILRAERAREVEEAATGFRPTPTYRPFLPRAQSHGNGQHQAYLPLHRPDHASAADNRNSVPLFGEQTFGGLPASHYAPQSPLEGGVEILHTVHIDNTRPFFGRRSRPTGSRAAALGVFPPSFADDTPAMAEPQLIPTRRGPLTPIELVETTTADLDLYGYATKTYIMDVFRNPNNSDKDAKRLSRSWMRANSYTHECTRCQANGLECDGEVFCDNCGINDVMCHYSICEHGADCTNRALCKAIHPEFCIAMIHGLNNYWGCDGLSNAERLLDMHRQDIPSREHEYMHTHEINEQPWPTHSNHLPPPGSALPFSPTNPYGYKDGDPIDWIKGLTSLSLYHEAEKQKLAANGGANKAMRDATTLGSPTNIGQADQLSAAE